MMHELPPPPENEQRTLRFSPGDDVPIHVAAHGPEPEDQVVSDNSRSPSPGYRPTSRHLLPSRSTKEIVSSTTTSVAAGSKLGRRYTYLLRNWWLEIGACFTFVVAMLAIVVTLRPHQGKPLPQWPYSISLNSLISIYVVVLKATVLLVTAEGIGQLKWRWFRNERPLKDIAIYDAASRGPLGSFSLLWTLGLRHPLSSCGAIITVLMLAIDPFAQQIIRYQGCSVSVDGPQAKASIPRTNYFAAGGDYRNGKVPVEPQLQSTINAGIFSPGSIVNPLCSTGNCSFLQQYDTLGYCGGCTDTTDNLTFVKDDLSDGSESIVSYLPSGLSINSTNSIAQTTTSYNLYSYNLAIMGSTYLTGDWSPELSQIAEIIVGKNPHTESPAGQPFQVLNETCQSGDSSWYCLKYGAARCALSPCVRTYTGSIASGSFQEILVSQTDDTSMWASSYDSSNLATVDTKCISLADHNSLIAAGYGIDPDKRWLPYSLTLDPSIHSNSSFPSSMLQDNCVYIVDSLTAGSLWSQYLANFFNGTVGGTPDDFGVIDSYTGPQNIQTIYDYGNVTLESVDSIFRNISDSLTTFIRQSGNANHSTPVTGTVWHDDTCLEVRWGWLALPAVLVLLTVFFFAITLIVTRPTGGRADVWKSSPLALIFHGLEAADLVQANSALQDTRDMDRAAEGIIVRLAPSGNGVTLVAAGGKGSNGE